VTVFEAKPKVGGNAETFWIDPSKKGMYNGKTVDVEIIEDFEEAQKRENILPIDPAVAFMEPGAYPNSMNLYASLNMTWELYPMDFSASAGEGKRQEVMFRTGSEAVLGPGLKGGLYRKALDILLKDFGEAEPENHFLHVLVTSMKKWASLDPEEFNVTPKQAKVNFNQLAFALLHQPYLYGLAQRGTLTASSKRMLPYVFGNTNELKPRSWYRLKEGIGTALERLRERIEKSGHGTVLVNTPVTEVRRGKAQYPPTGSHGSLDSDKPWPFDTPVFVNGKRFDAAIITTIPQHTVKFMAMGDEESPEDTREIELLKVNIRLLLRFSQLFTLSFLICSGYCLFFRRVSQLHGL
jgi:hypothetical protein